MNVKYYLDFSPTMDILRLTAYIDGDRYDWLLPHCALTNTQSVERAIEYVEWYIRASLGFPDDITFVGNEWNVETVSLFFK